VGPIGKWVQLPNNRVQQTGHANEVLSSFSALSRVSRLLSIAFGGGEAAVKAIAAALVYLMESLVRASDEGLDGQMCGDVLNEVWFELAKSSPSERQALAEAAAARLADWLREPDEYGYTPRSLVTPAHRDLLEGLADGSAWHEFDHPEGE
jgi:hypothetical protein